MSSVTLEEVRRLCSQYEGTLRASCTEAGLPPEWEVALAAAPAGTAMQALGRFALLKHYYLTRQQQIEAREAAAPEDRDTAARQLLRREPVRVNLGRRTAEVTGRSYGALYEIAAHDAEIRALEVDIEMCARLTAESEAELAASPGWRRRGVLRRRVKRLRRVHARLYRELRTQRRWLYAHALTPTGAPARSLDDAPEWVDEIDQEADALLLMAVIEAGHRRYARLGEPPQQKDAGKGRGEDFGWASLFASVERQQKLPSGTLVDADLFQLRAWLRAGAPPPMGSED